MLEGVVTLGVGDDNYLLYTYLQIHNNIFRLLFVVCTTEYWNTNIQQ